MNNLRFKLMIDFVTELVLNDFYINNDMNKNFDNYYYFNINSIINVIIGYNKQNIFIKFYSNFYELYEIDIKIPDYLNMLDYKEKLIILEEIKAKINNSLFLIAVREGNYVCSIFN